MERRSRESICVPTCAAFSQASSECTLFHRDDIVADLDHDFRSNKAERECI